MPALLNPSVADIRNFSNTSSVSEYRNNGLLDRKIWAESTVIFPHDIYTFSETAKLLISKTERFRILKKGFDSYNADAPSVLAIENAILFIKQCDKAGLPLYFVAPGRNGEVLVEFKNKYSKAAEIYFNADGSKEMILYNNEISEYEGVYDISLLNQFLNARS